MSDAPLRDANVLPGIGPGTTPLVVESDKKCDFTGKNGDLSRNEMDEIYFHH